VRKGPGNEQQESCGKYGLCQGTDMSAYEKMQNMVCNKGIVLSGETTCRNYGDGVKISVCRLQHKNVHLAAI